MLSLSLRRMASSAGIVLAALAAQGSVGAVSLPSAPHGALIASGISVDVSVSESESFGVPSPDSRNLYIAAGFDGRSRIVVVRREPATGRLLKLKRGCSFHCSYADGLNNPEDVAVTPDGLDVIVSSRRSRLSVYRRAGDGRLRMVSCFGWQLAGIPCPTSRIQYYPDIAVSPDSRHLYVSSWNGQRRLDLLARDATTGRLHSLGGRDGCFMWALAPNDQCRFTITPGFYPQDVTISPDGTNVYVLGTGGFYVFHRDVRSGGLTLLPGLAGCYRFTSTPNCTRVRDVQSSTSPATSVRVPRDGRHAYVGRRVFRRDASTGVLTLLDVRVPYNIQFSPDGLTAYQVGRNLRVYRRNTSGALTLLPQPFGILPGSANEVAVMPDARHVYVTGNQGTTRVYRVAG
jgi:DNA-binding beta-propeller fold protein YncE